MPGIPCRLYCIGARWLRQFGRVLAIGGSSLIDPKEWEWCEQICFMSLSQERKEILEYSRRTLVLTQLLVLVGLRPAYLGAAPEFPFLFLSAEAGDPAARLHACQRLVFESCMAVATAVPLSRGGRERGLGCHWLIVISL